MTKDLDEVTDKTSFFEKPGAHITYAWMSVGEDIGRTFETAVDFDEKPEKPGQRAIVSNIRATDIKRIN